LAAGILSNNLMSDPTAIQNFMNGGGTQTQPAPGSVRAALWALRGKYRAGASRRANSRIILHHGKTGRRA
jgi:hypothetical protein